MNKFENIVQKIRECKTEYELLNGNSDEYNNGYIDAINEVLSLIKNEVYVQTLLLPKETSCGACSNVMVNGFCEICGRMNNENNY